MDDRHDTLIRRAAELKAESAALVMVSEELVGRVAQTGNLPLPLAPAMHAWPALARSGRPSCLRPVPAAGLETPTVTAQVKFPSRGQGHASWTRTKPWRSPGCWKSWPPVTSRTR
jgi:hypothetical protein